MYACTHMNVFLYMSLHINVRMPPCVCVLCVCVSSFCVFRSCLYIYGCGCSSLCVREREVMPMRWWIRCCVWGVCVLLSVWVSTHLSSPYMVGLCVSGGSVCVHACVCGCVCGVVMAATTASGTPRRCRGWGDDDADDTRW